MRRTPDRVLRRLPQLRTLLAVLIAAGLCLPACSTGSEDATNTSAGATGASAAQETEAPLAAEQESAAAAADGAGTQDAEDMLAGVDFDAEYCEFRDQVIQSGLMNADPDPEDMDAFLDQAVQMYDALVEKAPPEIADDVQTIADGVTQQVESAETPEEAEEMVDGLTNVAEAQDRVSQWEAENC